MPKIILFIYSFSLLFFSCQGQNQQEGSGNKPKTNTGPVINKFGAVYEVTEADMKVHENDTLKVVFDVGKAFDDKNKTNLLIESAARFLNLHAQNGVPVQNIKVALVIHGGAAHDILKNSYYHEKFDADNPNALLLEELEKAGVDIYLCGQTAAHRNITREKALPQVKFALSAMTALVKLQNEEYRLINF
ncbi:DsrE family protein [Abyssalbus ytuae]|uniref:DsrE family protein n=1 Tax=Abyssalbus ytuae TaxID=2926907 RepID=A0A9E6ZN03_9FLAO|nr:DsrE family protein [Abyssalbus ytuae]UOB17330.1 DsrE family protein [Abyssalbus ytuae]